MAVLLATGLLLIGTGMLFKFEHWDFNAELLLVAAPIVAGSYFWWYLAKKQRQLLDHLKLSWVLGATAAVVAVAVFHPLVKPLARGTEVLFWSMALLYLYQRWIQRPKQISS
jgi:hypothetical protein